MSAVLKSRLERLAEDLERRFKLAVEAYDAAPTPEREHVVAQLRSQQRQIAQRILELELGDQD